MALEILVNTGSGIGLLPDGTKPFGAITWTNVDLSSVKSCGTHLRTISLEMLQESNMLLSICYKITHSQLLPYLSRDNEFDHEACLVFVYAVLYARKYDNLSMS